MTRDVVLVVDKPSGITSFDVVRKVRRAARVRHVGHGGTLDPLASGVLPICVGEATKLAQFLLDADKAYDVTVRLGLETDTDDADGVVTASVDASAIGEAAVREALVSFRGPQRQVPPVYSALKREGRPLYAYARAGAPITAEAREVVVHSFDLLRFGGPDEVVLAVHCSKGTYVRALARDLGRALGVGAHVTRLRRTRSGPFSLAAARPLVEVLDCLASGRGALPAVSLPEALGHLPRRTVSDEVARDLRMGRKLAWEMIAAERPHPSRPRLCLLDGAGALVTVAEPRSDGTAKTLRVFNVASVSTPGTRELKTGSRNGPHEQGSPPTYADGHHQDEVEVSEI
jgi:tRNA pseudouridine55 synthase